MHSTPTSYTVPMVLPTHPGPPSLRALTPRHTTPTRDTLLLCSTEGLLPMLAIPPLPTLSPGPLRLELPA